MSSVLDQTENGSRQRLGWIVFAGVALPALIYFVLTVTTVTFQDGCEILLHDPGKSLFHLVILPFVCRHIVLTTPSSLLERSWATLGAPLVLSVAIFLIACATFAISVGDRNALYESVNHPADLASMRTNAASTWKTSRKDWIDNLGPLLSGDEEEERVARKAILTAKDNYRTAFAAGLSASSPSWSAFWRDASV